MNNRSILIHFKTLDLHLFIIFKRSASTTNRVISCFFGENINTV